MAREIYITTTDNPFDPSKDFDEWYNYDEFVLGYHSSQRLAARAYTSDALSDSDYEEEIENSIDALVSENPKLYKKIVI